MNEFDLIFKLLSYFVIIVNNVFKKWKNETMKAVFERLEAQQFNSFIVRRIELPNFDAPFHFHPEYELTLILKGEGQRYVGSQVKAFIDGDMVFLGSNLPHCWINQRTENENVSSIVIQFGDPFLGKELINLPEMQKIKSFFDKSKMGIEIVGVAKEQIAGKMHSMVQQSALQRMLTLIEILDLLSNNQDYLSIDSYYFENNYNQSETSRFQKVFSFLIENFKEEIRLEQIADIAGLSPTSFCRYFKGITHKTFSEVVIEFRLQFASQLLLKTNLQVRNVALESGFGDVPYFNRQFLKHKGISPMGYRQKHLFK